MSDSDIKDTFSIELVSDGHVEDISYHSPIKFNNIIQIFYHKYGYNKFFNLKKMIIETTLNHSDKGFYCFSPWSYPPRIMFVPRQSRSYHQIFFSDNIFNQWFRKP